LDGGLFETPDIAVTDSDTEVRGTRFRPVHYEKQDSFSTARRWAANTSMGLLPRAARSAARTWDIRTAAWFPDPEGKNLQVGYDGPTPVKTIRSWPKSQCRYSNDQIVLPVDARPMPGDFLQCDQSGLTTWVVTSVTGRTCRLERINNRDKDVDTKAGHFYLIRGAVK